MATFNKQDVVNFKKTDQVTIDAIKKDITSLCENSITLDICDLDVYRSFLMDLQDKTGIPRPVLEYYLFGVSCSFS